jgi:TonB-linked outer membrane protein, SusC/RagA family
MKSFFKARISLAVIILIASIQLVYATNDSAQIALLKLNVKNVTVENVLKSIENQSAFTFFYNTTQVDVERKVSISANNEDVLTVLDKVFQNTDVAYSVKGKHIILSNKLQKNSEDVSSQKNITGTVVDANGEPIIGASVRVRNSSTGTITNIQGNFSLTVSANVILEVSYIGYITQTIPVGERIVFEITLKEDALQLNEVVIVGYGVQKKSVVTAAIGKVDAEQLVSNNPANLQQALQGKASGIQITSNSGQPGSEAIFRIRGTGTINNNSPLFLIDGFPSDASALGAINPNDISSVEVLKDAASAAIYGARAANGVVLVTTKTGKTGRVSINYDYSYGMQRPWKKMKLTSAVDYQMLMNEAYENAGKPGPYDNPSVSATNTNWQSEVFYNDAPVVNHQFSINGGSDRMVYYLSFGILNQDGIMAKGKSFYDRYSFRSNTTYTLFDSKKERSYLNKLTFGSNISFIHVKQDGIDANREFGGVIASALSAPPNIAPYVKDQATLDEYDSLYPNHVKDKHGNVYSIIDNMGEIGNPLALINIRNMHNMNRELIGSFNLSLDVLPGLTARTNATVSFNNSSTRSWIPTFYIGANQFATNSSVEQGKSDGHRWQWENVLSYTNTFAEKHNVSALVGTSAMKEETEYARGRKFGMIAENDDKGFIDGATDESSQKAYGYNNDHMISSMFARLSYNFDERYLFEATVRRDGSSNFPKKKRYATFPSVSAGWVLTNEPFMEPYNKDWLNFIKLRASWGQNGNENIGAFMYTSNMATISQGAVFGKDKELYPGFTPAMLANNDLTWETSEQTNIGVDMRFFNSSLSLTADYFIKKTKDMLMRQPIPSYVGNTAPYANVGTMENRGVEFELSYRKMIQNVMFNIGGNISYTKNEVTDLGAASFLPGNLWNYQTVTRSEVGRPFNFFYGHIVEGIFRNEEDVLAHKSPDGTVLQPTAKPGDFIFKNITNDNVINGDDRAYIGQSNPKWLYGFNTGLEWKGFDFNMFFQGQSGNKIYDGTRRLEIADANFHNEYLDRFHPTKNPDGNFPRMTIQDDNSNFRINSFFVKNGSYLRLKNIQLGYSLPENLLRKYLVTKCRLYASVENAFTITKYDGFDPEVGNNGGIDMGNYPQARIFTLGLNIGF